MWAIELSDPWSKGKHHADVETKEEAERIRYGLKTTGADHVDIWDLDYESFGRGISDAGRGCSLSCCLHKQE